MFYTVATHDNGMIMINISTQNSQTVKKGAAHAKKAA